MKQFILGIFKLYLIIGVTWFFRVLTSSEAQAIR